MEISPDSKEIINKWKEGGKERAGQLRRARELYENLPDDIKNEIDVLSDTVTDIVMGEAEEKIGKDVYLGSQFRNDLVKACRDFASGYSRDREHFSKAFLSEPRWKGVVDDAFDRMSASIDDYSNLRELTQGPDESVEIEVGEQSAANDNRETLRSMNPEGNEEIEIVMDRELLKSTLEEQTEWLQSLQMNSEADILSTTSTYLENYPGATRTEAVQRIFNYADLVPGLEGAKKRVSCEASIIDNFSGDTISDQGGLQKLIEHHQYKYDLEMESVGITFKGLVSLIIGFGKFSTDFTKEAAEKFVAEKYQIEF